MWACWSVRVVDYGRGTCVCHPLLPTPLLITLMTTASSMYNLCLLQLPLCQVCAIDFTPSHQYMLCATFYYKFCVTHVVCCWKQIQKFEGSSVFWMPVVNQCDHALGNELCANFAPCCFCCGRWLDRQFRSKPSDRMSLVLLLCFGWSAFTVHQVLDWLSRVVVHCHFHRGKKLTITCKSTKADASSGELILWRRANVVV